MLMSLGCAYGELGDAAKRRALLEHMLAMQECERWPGIQEFERLPARSALANFGVFICYWPLCWQTWGTRTRCGPLF